MKIVDRSGGMEAKQWKQVVDVCEAMKMSGESQENG